MATKSPQLVQRFALFGAALALALMVALGLVAARIARDGIERLSSQRGLEVASRVGALASNYMLERRREVELLAADPAVATAAAAAARSVTARRLDQLSPATLERIFSGRYLSADSALTRYLRTVAARSRLAQIIVTDPHGFVVATARPTDRFVQSDEVWWRTARRDSVYEGEPSYDSAAVVVTINYAVAIRPPGTTTALGVVNARISLERLPWLLAVQDLGDSAYLQVVDSAGRLLVTPNPTELLQPPAQATLIPRVGQPDTVTVPTDRGPELVASIPANRGKWWVLFRQPKAQAYAAARGTVRTIWIGVGLLLAVSGLVLWQLVRWLSRRVTDPVRAAGQIASRIASGDLSVTIPAQRAQTAEVGDLLASVHTMVLALRRLVGAIRSASEEASAMAAEISAATQQMSASTEQMAATAQDLTRRASEQSELVRAAADHAGRILEIATVLSAGADEAARRNTALSELARKHRELLDESTAQLEHLAEEVTRGAAEAEALAQASTEIQKFVAQAKGVATQTNMLALNAAIEAARAGPQGRGFAVVADEVRKLAAQAAGAAGETSDIVRGVLGRVQATRDRLVRLAASGAAAREAAQVAAQALSTVAAEADANDAWSREIASSANDARTLVEGVASRLGSVAQGTESLVAAAEQLAASGQQQSASTEQIASSANQLAEAADRLTAAVQSFRLLAPADVNAPRAEAAD